MPLPVTLTTSAGVPYQVGDTYSTPFGGVVTVTQQILDSGLLNGAVKSIASHSAAITDPDASEKDLQSALDAANTALANELSGNAPAPVTVTVALAAQDLTIAQLAQAITDRVAAGGN